MHIDMVGGGSIGLLLGARLAEEGGAVTIWTRTEQQAVLLEEQGIRLLESDGRELVVPVHSKWIGDRTSPSVRHGGPRVVVLTVKQTALDDGLWNVLARMMDERATIVAFQNGIGHMERLSALFPESGLLAAVTTEGAKRVDGCTVQHTGAGDIWFGPWQAGIAESRRQPELEKMFALRLKSAGFASHMSNQMEIHIFYKLLINAVINPLSALHDVRNGQLPEHPARLRLMKMLYEESTRVLHEAQKPVHPDGWQRVLEVCRATGNNVSSMLADVRAGRETEIRAINGQIVKMAADLGMRAPLNEAVTELVHALFSGADPKE